MGVCWGFLYAEIRVADLPRERVYAHLVPFYFCLCLRMRFVLFVSYVLAPLRMTCFVRAFASFACSV